MFLHIGHEIHKELVEHKNSKLKLPIEMIKAIALIDSHLLYELDCQDDPLAPTLTQLPNWINDVDLISAANRTKLSDLLADILLDIQTQNYTRLYTETLIAFGELLGRTPIGDKYTDYKRLPSAYKHPDFVLFAPGLLSALPRDLDLILTVQQYQYQVNRQARLMFTQAGGPDSIVQKKVQLPKNITEMFIDESELVDMRNACKLVKQFKKLAESEIIRLAVDSCRKAKEITPQKELKHHTKSHLTKDIDKTVKPVI